VKTKLLPDMTIRQILGISNVATMINGMLRLLLAKMSVGSIIKWVEVGKNADPPMNLLQR
jgi:hypothetical protein